MSSDRIFGLIMGVLALTYIVSATQIQVSFLSDPVGPKGFPILVGIVWAVSAITMVLRPDAEPDWPAWRTIGAIAIAFMVMVAYAYLLKPLGFLIPTAVVAGILSYQINPGGKHAVITGVGISVCLFGIFKYILGLGLAAVPKAWLVG